MNGNTVNDGDNHRTQFYSIAGNAATRPGVVTGIDKDKRHGGLFLYPRQEVFHQFSPVLRIGTLISALFGKNIVYVIALFCSEECTVNTGIIMNGNAKFLEALNAICCAGNCSAILQEIPIDIRNRSASNGFRLCQFLFNFFRTPKPEFGIRI